MEAGHDIIVTEDIGSQAGAFGEYAPHCLILNLNSVDGCPPFRLLDDARSWFDGAIIAVSEACDESVRVTAFERGADDYICVPFGLDEFVARLDALLRRTIQRPRPRLLNIGGLHIDRGARTATLNGQPLELTNKEFDILVCLGQNHGLVVSAEALLKQVWGTEFTHYHQTLRVHISNLRKKTRSVSPLPDFIRSVTGNGYVLAFR
jgi:DNA-binding response OmpR family regulator